MNRYNKTVSVEQNGGPKYNKSAIPIKFVKEEVPFYYTAVSGDRFDTLSYLFYKTPAKWWVIAQANGLTNGTISIKAGTKLYIPNV